MATLLEGGPSAEQARTLRLDFSMWLIVATTATGESAGSLLRGTKPRLETYSTLWFDTPMPIRLVDPDEPWEKAVQDVQKHIGSKVSGQEVHVGFYGHGAFVKPEELEHDLPFVAALGLVARMDVMIFPQLPFPEKILCKTSRKTSCIYRSKTSSKIRQRSSRLPGIKRTNCLGKPLRYGPCGSAPDRRHQRLPQAAHDPFTCRLQQ